MAYAGYWAQDPVLPIGEVATAEQLLARSASQSRFNLALLAAFAACGLLLAKGSDDAGVISP